MKIYCIEEFKAAYDKLIKKKPYRDLTEELIDYFFDKSISDLKEGRKLFGHSIPFIKTRTNGRSGYRLYYYFLIQDNQVFLMFVHPKTGPDGFENIDDAYKPFIFNQVLTAIENDNLHEVIINKIDNTLKFKKKKSEKTENKPLRKKNK